MLQEMQVLSIIIFSMQDTDSNKNKKVRYAGFRDASWCNPTIVAFLIPGRSPGHTTALSINKKLLAERTKFVLCHLLFVGGQYNYSVYSTVSRSHPIYFNLISRSILHHLY